MKKYSVFTGKVSVGSLMSPSCWKPALCSVPGGLRESAEPRASQSEPVVRASGQSQTDGGRAAPLAPC